MSAYALPGAFYLPVPGVAGSSSGCTFQSSFKCTTDTGGEAKSASDGDYECSQSLQGQKATLPQHFVPSGSTLQFKPISFSTIKPSPIAADSPLTPAPKILTAVESPPLDGGAKEVGISVKDAKIDPVRLIKSLTSRPKHIATTSNAAMCTPAKTVVGGPSVVSPSTDTSAAKTTPSIQLHQTNTRDDPHTEAIQFELSISFNGRTYMATRTLPRIMQLRDDLISEIRNSRRSRRKAVAAVVSSSQQRMPTWMTKRTKRNRKVSEMGDGYSEYGMNGVYDVDNDDDATVETVDLEDVSIPEIPDYCSEEERSFAGRGITLLHGLLRSYCPAIEGWLRKVTDLVPPSNSKALSKFLWEPVSGGGMTTSTSLNTLVSIKEDESEDEDRDDEHY